MAEQEIHESEEHGPNLLEKKGRSYEPAAQGNDQRFVCPSGSITACDGDRVMAVFIGGQKNSNAAKCGLRINYAVKEIIQPAIKEQYPDNTFDLRQVVGIDTSNLFIAQTGIRGSNDLVWVGRAANYAAKMAGFSPSYPTLITADVYAMLLDSSKYGGETNTNKWTDLGMSELGVKVYGSTWWWTIS